MLLSVAHLKHNFVYRSDLQPQSRRNSSTRFRNHHLVCTAQGGIQGQGDHARVCNLHATEKTCVLPCSSLFRATICPTVCPGPSFPRCPNAPPSSSARLHADVLALVPADYEASNGQICMRVCFQCVFAHPRSRRDCWRGHRLKPRRLIAVFKSVIARVAWAISSVASLCIRLKSASASRPTECFSNNLRRCLALCLRSCSLTSSHARSSVDFARRCGCGFSKPDFQTLLPTIAPSLAARIQGTKEPDAAH